MSEHILAYNIYAEFHSLGIPQLMSKTGAHPAAQPRCCLQDAKTEVKSLSPIAYYIAQQKLCKPSGDLEYSTERHTHCTAAEPFNFQDMQLFPFLWDLEPKRRGSALLLLLFMMLAGAGEPLE